MHTVEVTILEPEAEAILDELESKNMVRLSKVVANGRRPLEFGCMKGLVLSISPDFDEPLEDFKEYM